MISDLHVARVGSGPPVLMIHGGPQGSPAGGAQQWAAQRPLADAGWELVLPDRPGHGQTPSRGPEDMELDADWVAEMLGSGAHLLGHSYGGCIALAAAGRRPEAVRSLTLIEAPVFAAAPDESVVALRAEIDRIVNADLEPVARLIEFSQAMRIPTERPGPPPNRDVLGRMGAGLAAMRSPTSWDGRPALDAIARARLPVLAVTGGWSPGMAAIGDGIAAMTGGEHSVIECGHHFPQLAADRFNPQLVSFLGGAASA